MLSEFKAVVLASLRSLVSSDWDSDHEAGWQTHTEPKDGCDFDLFRFLGAQYIISPLQKSECMLRLPGIGFGRDSTSY